MKMKMKIDIRSIIIFPDEILVYRGSRCRKYPCAWNNKRKIRVIDKIWSSGKIKRVVESPLVPSWDITYEFK